MTLHVHRHSLNYRCHNQSLCQIWIVLEKCEHVLTSQLTLSNRYGGLECDFRCPNMSRNRHIATSHQHRRLFSKGVKTQFHNWRPPLRFTTCMRWYSIWSKQTKTLHLSNPPPSTLPITPRLSPSNHFRK